MHTHINMGPRYINVLYATYNVYNFCVSLCKCVRCNGEIYSRYLCQLNRGLRGSGGFPWVRRARGGFRAGHLRRDVFIYASFIRTQNIRT